MKCEFNYCIYYSDGICTLEEIQINSLGICDECIIVSVGKDYLEKARQNQLQDIRYRCHMTLIRIVK